MTWSGHRDSGVPLITVSTLDNDPFLAENTYEVCPT